MTISELGCTGYVSPFGSQAICRHISSGNGAINETSNDSFVKKHKEKDNTTGIIGNVLLTAGALFGIYKGRNYIKPAYNTVKNYAGQAYNYVKQSGIKASVVQGAKTLGTKLQNGYSTLKTKVSSTNFTQTLKTLPSTIWNGIKTFASKIHK